MAAHPRGSVNGPRSRHRKLDPELLDLQVRHLELIRQVGADQNGVLICDADVESERARRLGIKSRNDRHCTVSVSETGELIEQ